MLGLRMYPFTSSTQPPGRKVCYLYKRRVISASFPYDNKVCDTGYNASIRSPISICYQAVEF